MSNITSLMMEVSNLQSREIQNLRIQMLVMEEAISLQKQIQEKKAELADLEQENQSRSVQDESSMSEEDNGD